MKTVLITGGNKGIGLEICRQLDKLGWQVILCSRNFDKGVQAAQNLSKNILTHQLDVKDETSIQNLLTYVSKEIGKLDVLINNAGMGANSQENPGLSNVKRTIKKHFRIIYALSQKAKPFLNQSKLFNENISAGEIPLSRVKDIMETNFYGVWRMIQVFVPLLKKGESPQIINVSSGMGTLSNLTGLYPGYSLSKASLNALTILFSNELRSKNIKVNAVNPGWVKTDMGGPDAPRTVEEGADTVVWLANQINVPSGKFFMDRREIEW
ncbi:MAG: SDR family oxidoreductase [Bacteroidales bacterium]|nr:SDR family oxidoreductase [Bacteroidales bacterium]